MILPDLQGEILKVAPNVKLVLDLSGTPDRINPHPTTQTFTNPSFLKLESGAKMDLAPLAQMFVLNHSELSLSSGATMRLASEAVLIVDSYSKLLLQAGSRLEIADGARLVLKSTADLQMAGEIVLSGSGQVIIETGANYLFESTASLQLIDDASQLLIQGTWTIGDQASFGFSGAGFVELDLPNTIPNVNMGTSAEIRLSGQGFTDKILVIADGRRLSPSNDLAAFSITNGRVEMGIDASIVLPPTPEVELINLSVAPIQSPALHGGIFLQDLAAHSIQDVHISYGKNGIIYYASNPTAEVLKVLRGSIFACDYGIRTFGSSAKLTQVGLSQNTEGWRAWAATKPGYFGSVSQFGPFGIHYQGIGSLFLDQSTNSDHTIAVLLDGNVELQANCATIERNNDTGISLFNGASLDLSGIALGNVPAQLTTAQNATTISLQQAGNILLAGGYNDLAPINGGYAISGSLSSSCAIIDGTNNHWNTSGNAPISGVDYYVTGPLGCAIDIIDMNPITPLACGAAPCPDCPNNIQAATYCGSCESLNLSINGQSTYLSLPQAVREAELLLGPGSTPFQALEACQQLLQILVYPYQEVDSAENYWLNQAYQSMIQAIVMAHRESENIALVHPQRTAVISYLAGRLGENLNYGQRLRYSSDLAALYRVGGEVQQALANFQSMLSFVQAEDLSAIETWICLLQKEEALQSGLLSLTEFAEQLSECETSTFSARLASDRQKLEEQPANMPIKVYPNPSTDVFQLEVYLEKEDQVKLEVLDMYGKSVQTILDKKSLAKGLHRFQIATKGWAAGVYVLRYHQAQQLYEQKLMLTR